MKKKTMRTGRANVTPKRRPPRQQKRPSPKKKKPDLSTSGLTKMISGFYTFHSTLKNLSESLQRMEKIMDNAYQMFEMANTFVGEKQSPPRRPPLRLVQPQREEPEEEQIPRLNLPYLDGNPDPGTPSQPHPFQNFDFTQLLKILQLPFVRQLLSDFMQGSSPQRGATRKRKQG